MDREAAFKQLYDEYRDRIYRMCCYYVAGEGDRKDLYQEVMANIWKGLGGFRGDSALSTWIYRVTVNSALAFISREKARKKKSAEYAAEAPLRHASTQESADQRDIDRLYRAIARLPLLDMIIMSLVVEDAGTKEISRATGLTEGNVRVRIHRAKKRLKELIEGEEP
jgi:RNA polymerase sigma-70 factor (ECF subfamily)